VRYALASQWSQRIRHELLGDPLKQAALLNATDPPIATWAIVESIEAIYQATSRHSRDDATDGLKEHLRAFDILEQVNAERPDMLRDLRHHRGKVLKWLGETAAAEACFRELVQADPRFAAARLQLARILAHDATRRGEASSELIRILEAAESAPASVSRNVLLAALELLGRNELAEFAADIVANHLELLRRAVLQSSCGRIW
jgi:tetratricopeptide (TPR) repeat protein